MRILVLGGHGFVGKQLVAKLEEIGHKPICRSRQDGLDLRDLEATKECFEEICPDIIYHVAAHVGSLHYVAKFAGDVLYDNVQIALNIYKAAVACCPEAKIINPLSNCSYPGDANKHIEEYWWQGEVHDSVFSYGNAKRIIYVISRNFHKQYGIRSINFLVPNMFGIGDYTDPNRTHALNGMIIRMILAVRREEQQFEIWGSGKPMREWGYVKDIVHILTKGIELKNEQIYPVNIAQNRGYSIRDSAGYIARALDFRGRLVFNRGYADGAPIKVLDDKHFRRLFPDYKFCDHKKAIEETIAYYQEVL